MPESLQNDLKPEYGGNLFVPPSPPKVNLPVPEEINQTPLKSILNNNSIEISPKEPSSITFDEEEISTKQIKNNNKRKEKNKYQNKFLTKPWSLLIN